MWGPGSADPKMGILGRQSCWEKGRTGLSWNWDYWGSEMPNWFPSTEGGEAESSTSNKLPPGGASEGNEGPFS